MVTPHSMRNADYQTGTGAENGTTGLILSAALKFRRCTINSDTLDDKMVETVNVCGIVEC